MSVPPVIHLDCPTIDDHDAVAALLEQPMPGRIAFSMTENSEPNGDGDERHHEVVARDQHRGEIIGYASRSVREVWIHGERRRIGYLRQLRVNPGRQLPLRVARAAFDALAATRRTDEEPYDFTSIMANNDRARRLLERGVRGFPRYQRLGDLTTYVVRTRRGPSSAVDIASTDEPQIHECLTSSGRHWALRPIWSGRSEPQQFLTVRQSGRIRSCGALWDRRAAHGISVARYTRSLRIARPALNAMFRLTGAPMLPRPGVPMRLGFLSHISLAADTSTEDLLALLSQASNLGHQQGLSHLCLAMPGEHAACRIIHRRFRAWERQSIIYAVQPANAARPQAIESRSAWPEVAEL